MTEEVSSFFWYVSLDSFRETEEGDFEVDIDLSAGRLRHRWVPTNKAAARMYLREHEEAVGLRSAEDRYALIKVKLVEPMADLSEKYPNAIPDGMRGAVIRVPFKATLPSKQMVDKLAKGETPHEGPHYSMGRKDLIETAEIGGIGAIQMGIMSDEQVLAMSTVEIWQDDVIDMTNALNPRPITNGLMDLRLGGFEIADTHIECNTCQQQFSDEEREFGCQGHFGHISLQIPLPKFLYLGSEKRFARPNSPMMYTLNNICHHCSKPYIPKEMIEEIRPAIESVWDNNERNFQGYAKIRRLISSKYAVYHKDGRRSCPHCGLFSPKFNFDHQKAEFFTNQPHPDFNNGLRNYDCLAFTLFRDVLSGISDEDARFMGFDPYHAHPRNMFMEKMPVGPNSMRPLSPVPGEDNRTELDDVTKLYLEVVINNQNLKEAIRNELQIYRQVIYGRLLYLSACRVTDNLNRNIGSGGTKTQRGFKGSDNAVSF